MPVSINTSSPPRWHADRKPTTLPLRRWVIYATINLFLVSLLGVLLRYKSVLSLPVFQYDYLLHAHSHFAFSGWVTTALFAGLLYLLHASGGTPSRVYRYQFWLNQFSSFGMLVSFTLQGYGPVSIVFSSLSVVFSYWFGFCYWRDTKTMRWPPALRRAIQFALFYLVLSSLGPYMLAYSRSHAAGDSAFYYNSIYFYLHFQYNGWFTFGVIALLCWWVFPETDTSLTRTFVPLLGVACIPAYCLSLLWTNPPPWIWIVATLAVLLQLAAGITLVLFFVRNRARWSASLPVAIRTIWCLSLTAFGIKLILQALSVTPTLGHLAFAHRSVIIAYLHLVLLGFVTLSLLGFFASQGLHNIHPRPAKTGLTLFTCGVLLNEGVLLIQSLSELSSRVWTNAGFWLLGARFCYARARCYFQELR